MGLKTLSGEIAAIRSLFDKNRREERKIVFYSESAIYYLYYEGFINYLLENTGWTITYITSDRKDPVFEKGSDRFKVCYISNAMLAFTTGLLDADTLLFTMPDLNNFHVKRSTKKVEHIYIFHAVMSAHMIYRKGAFDHYDTIFCIGPHHQVEIRETERCYGLKEKRLLEVGYPLLEKIHSEHLEYKQTDEVARKGSPLILVAPTWSEGNIVETCIDELIAALLKVDYRVILRPHPETYKQHGKLIRMVIDKYRDDDRFELETALTSVHNFHRADLLITDWSGIAFEYAFGTERPVLFINTPKKVYNSEYEKIGLEPLEVTVRDKIGAELEPEKIKAIDSVAGYLLAAGDSFKEKIINYREAYIYNWGNSAAVGGRYLIDALNRGQIDGD
jgi:YidC/Oxa1 family membrane protein insertase